MDKVRPVLKGHEFPGGCRIYGKQQIKEKGAYYRERDAGKEQGRKEGGIR